MNIKNIIVLFICICFICSMGIVSAHQGMENPTVVIDNLDPSQEVSGDVDFNMTVHEHNKVKYVNVVAEHIETRTKYLDRNDSNPNGGWQVSWDTSNSPNGEYWITATACDEKGLEGKSEMKLILNNIPKESKIILENPTAIVNKSTNIVAILKDNNSNPISGKAVEFVIDGNSYSADTVSGGFATVSFTPKEIRNYEITVKFKGDNKYLASQTSGMLKSISSLNATSVTINDVRANNKEKILLKAGLIVPGNYGSNINKKIDFYIDGDFLGYGYTDENGDAVFQYEVNKTGGTYLYQVKYQNESGYNFTDYASLYVPQSEIYITMHAVTYSNDGIFTVGNRFKVSYVVNNGGQDGAENTVFTYEVPNSLKYISSSVSKGILLYNSNCLTWSIGEVPVGSQTLEVMFEVVSAGKINLAPSISTVTYDESINSIPSNTFLTVNSYQIRSNDLVKYYGGTGKYRVYIYNNGGGAVSGANIKININKQVLNLRTNSKGYVELAINLKVGSYTIKATCNNLHKTNKIVIKTVLITKNIVKKKAKVIKFTAKVLNSAGKVVKNKKVTFKVKGKKYKVTTNKKGIATLKLKNLKVGKYVVYTSWGKLTNKNTIKVKK